MSRLMRQPDPSGRLLAKPLDTTIDLAEATERTQILAARLEKIEARHRPHYSPEARFRILEHIRKYLLSVGDTARRFLLTEHLLPEAAEFMVPPAVIQFVVAVIEC